MTHAPTAKMNPYLWCIALRRNKRTAVLQAIGIVIAVGISHPLGTSESGSADDNCQQQSQGMAAAL
jgi:hypothetical protein